LPSALAEALRDHLREAVGVPVTVGVARTRTLAKLISDTAKPFGALAVLDAGRERELLAQRPVTDITGIAERQALILQKWHGWKLAEIAEQLQCTPKAVAGLLARGLARLNKLVPQDSW
jgi:nucleotidyltransferase/DNA polymerase involved in DNA repair